MLIGKPKIPMTPRPSAAPRIPRQPRLQRTFAAKQAATLSGNISGGMFAHLGGLTNDHLGQGFKATAMPPKKLGNPNDNS